MISAKDCWREIKKPETVNDDDPILKLIYKAICMVIRLVLDVRYKLYYGDQPQAVNSKPYVKKIRKESEKLDNTVLKPTDLLKEQNDGERNN